MTFKEYGGLDLVKVADEVLQEWKKNGAFEKSLELREGAPEFIFFEGPPSANGMPGIHHVMARSIKDAVCRYKTQTGYKVRRRAGWDTHGLPVELGVEKKLGITKEDIGRKISVEEYNRTCREEVMKYTAEWRNLTERIGYWVDMDDPYITYDNRYIETLWYLLKDIHGKGLLYKGKSIQPYSPAAGTGLSSHELNQPGCYRDVKDTTCTVQFKVVGEENLYFLAWTTTPWTLPNPYTGEPATYIVARDLVPALFNGKIPYEVTGGCKGSELVGMRYEQLIPWFRPDEGAFRVIPGDYVSTEEGWPGLRECPRSRSSTRTATPRRRWTSRADSSVWRTSTPATWTSASATTTANGREDTSRTPTMTACPPTHPRSTWTSA